MYLSSDLVKHAYRNLINLDLSVGKSRMEKVSGLRYLLATSHLICTRKTPDIDLSVGSDLRNDFVSAVGDIVSLGIDNLYTKDFANSFERRSDYGVASNFLTTRLMNSRSQDLLYPGRPAPLLHLQQERISILSNINEVLAASYGIEKIKAELSIWLLRSRNFEVTSEKLNLSDLRKLIESNLLSMYTNDVVHAIFPSETEIENFLTDFNGVHFTESKPDLSDLIVEKLKAIEVPAEEIHVLSNTLADNDPVLDIAQQLLERGAKGILFSGPPGTSKTWYALKVALKIISGDENRLARVQFHPSFSYEDFIEGMVSTGSGLNGSPLFEPKTKIFLNFCNKAKYDPDNLYIFIIDEFTRGDPSKIFGELLTYIEQDYRGVSFTLPYSENKAAIPHNVIIFATMNPYDKSVSDIDSAMERRFEIIELPPSVAILKELLSATDILPEGLGKIISFFNTANRLAPHGFGHTYFKGVKSELDLLLLWNHKFKFIFERMFRFKNDLYAEVRQSFIDIVSDENKDKIK